MSCFSGLWKLEKAGVQMPASSGDMELDFNDLNLDDGTMVRVFLYTFDIKSPALKLSLNILHRAAIPKITWQTSLVWSWLTFINCYG